MDENPVTEQRRDPAVEKLLSGVADLELEDGYFRGDTTIVVPLDRLMEVVTFLKTDPDLLYNHLTDIAGMHYPEREKPFEVVYNLTSIPNLKRIRVKVLLAEGEKVPSMTGLWSGADWNERELYDMLGIQAEGHPNLTRIFMPDEFEDFPLRKDFPLRGRN